MVFDIGGSMPLEPLTPGDPISRSKANQDGCVSPQPPSSATRLRVGWNYLSSVKEAPCSDTPTGPLRITDTTRDQVDMSVGNRLARDVAVIHANVEA